MPSALPRRRFGLSSGFYQIWASGWSSKRFHSLTSMSKLLRHASTTAAAGETACTAATARRFLGYLRDKEIVAPAESQAAESALGDLIQRFEAYLSRERGLVQVTLDSYRPFVERFLVHCFKDEPLRFETLAASDAMPGR